MSKKESYAEHMLHIRQALKENRLAIFIGAGFSKVVNDDYPSWGEIIEELKKAMPQIQTSDFLQIAEHYRLEFGAIATKEKVKSYFPLKDNSSELHKQLIELYPHYIITTNWDNIFEKSLEETSLFYDIIAEDQDLPKSALNYKVIKMHGDFTHDNYVFTESDYLNYSYNFPLIEAYLKGIFTTHTILFLGYGFGDIDLKLIMTWLQNNSKNNRPRYMLVTENNYNDYSQKYYSNYGITLLPRENDKRKYFLEDDYIAFLKELDSQEFELTYTSPEDYIYNQLKPLEKLNHILSFQITQALTNCNILISNKKNLLQFYDQILIEDYNQAKRNAYKNFYLNLKNQKASLSIKQKKIISILQKAFIDGIYLGDNLYPSESFLFLDDTLPLPEMLGELLCFNYKIESKILLNNIQKLLYKMVCYYNLSQYEEALNCCEQLKMKTINSKQYEYYFISLWNYNAILAILKYHYIPDNISYDKNRTWENPYSNLKQEDLEKIYHRMPDSIQIAYKYITQEWLNDLLITTYNTLTDIKIKIREINRGGLSITNFSSLDYYLHQNLICFILGNGILLENNYIFKQICKNYFQIGLLRKKINKQGEIELSLIEVYSAIKYFTASELKTFFTELYDENTNISISKGTIPLFINHIFPNCLTGYATSHFQNFIEYLCNEFILLEYVQLTTENFKIIIDKINYTVNSVNNHIDFFKAINNFFKAQYDLCIQQSDFPVVEIFNIVITLLYKFINDKINFYEYNVIRLNLLFNIYHIALLCKLKFNNKELLKELILKIRKYEIKEKIKIISYVFINLYNISDIECCDIINNYIEENNKLIINEQFDFDIMHYELLLAYNKLFKITDKRMKHYLVYMEKYKDDAYDSRIDDIFYLLKKIKNSDSQLLLLQQFEELYNFIKNCIGSHQKRNYFHSVI